MGPDVVGFPLQEGLRRLRAQGYAYQLQYTRAPLAEDESFQEERILRLTKGAHRQVLLVVAVFPAFPKETL